MTTLPQPPPAKKYRRTPLGAVIAGLLSGELDTRRVMAEWCGELGDKALEAFQRVNWHELATKGGVPVFHPVDQHGPDEPCVRAACAHMLKVLERTGINSRRACSSALYRGRTHTINAEGQREYVPGKSAGGMAAQLGRCPRTLDRHCAVLEAAGLAWVWQPPAWDLPKDMRGVEYAYAIYQWSQPVPEAIARLLVQWYGTAAQKAASKAAARPSTAPPPKTAPRTTARSAELTAQFLARLEPS